MATTIKLQSSDSVEFVVPVEVARCSSTIKTMLEDLGMEEGDEEPIPLPNVTGDILKKVIDWATHHKDDPEPRPRPSYGDEDELPEWDANFLKMENEELFALTRAANYLDVKGLLDLCCQTVANLMKNKTPKEIRQLFGLDPKPETVNAN